MASRQSRSYSNPWYAGQLERYAPEESFRRAVKDVNHAVVQYVQKAYRSDPRFLTNHAEIDRLTALIAPAVQAGQLQIADLTNAHLSSLFGVEHPPAPDLSSFERQGVSRTTELARPFWTAIKAAEQGKDFDAAMAAGEHRLSKMVETDLQMAKVRQSREVLKTGGIQRYARVTGGNACWLCEIAATQVYYTEDLLPIHPSCVVSGTLVAVPSDEAGSASLLGSIEAATRQKFVGEIVELSTASGNLVRVTPNHPVLTDKGWIPAGLIRKGDNVFRSLRGERPVDGRPDVAQRPSRIEDVFAAASVTGRLLRVPTTAEDFHGDGSDSEVDVVWTASDLALPLDVLSVQQPGELCLMHAHGLGVPLVGQGAFDGLVGTRFAASRSNIRGGGDRGALLDGGAFVSQSGGSLRSARFNPTAAQFSGDGIASYAEQGRALIDRLAGKVERDSVIECRRVSFAGHVFNLQTAEGWYVADNIVLSNCNCSVAPIPDGGEAEIRKGFTPEEILKHSDEQVRKMLGLVEGGAPLKDYQDLVAVREHGEIGPMLTWEHQSFTGPNDLPVPVGLPGKASAVKELEWTGPFPKLPEPPKPVHINGVGYALEGTGIDPDLAAKFQGAVQDMKVKYPQSKLSAVLMSNTPGGAPAATFPYGGGPGGYLSGETHIRVNKAEMGSKTGKTSWYEWITGELKINPRIVAHHANNDVAYELGLHEFGHTLAFTGGNRDIVINEVDPTLRKLYRDLHPGMTKVDVKEYNAWKRKQLSGYSFQEGAWAKLNKDEALAEAFASVESNPEKATEAEHALHDLLVKNSLRPQMTAKALLERDFDAIAKPAEVVAAKEKTRGEKMLAKYQRQATKVAKDAEAQAKRDIKAKEKADKYLATYQKKVDKYAENAEKAAAKAEVQRVKDAEKAHGYGSVLQRVPTGTEIKPIYKLNPDGSIVTKLDKKTGELIKQVDCKAVWDKLLADDGAGLEVLRQNWREAVKATQPWAMAAGKRWYPDLGKLADRLVGMYGKVFQDEWGIPLTHDLVSTFFATFSENNKWAGNLLGVRKFLDGTGARPFGLKLADYDYAKRKMTIVVDGKNKTVYRWLTEEGKPYDFHVDKSLRAMKNPRGGIADLRENADTAPKPADFGANIAGDYSRGTADRWVSRIMLHTDDKNFAEQMRSYGVTKAGKHDPLGYKRFSQILSDLAPEYPDLNVAALQAGPWIQVVGPSGSIAYIEDLSSMEAINLETLRRVKELTNSL